MAIDKAVDSAALNSNLTSVANAIRQKGGTSGSLAFPSGFVTAIGNLPTPVPVQTATGNLTMNGSGATTVNCGFVPDLVVIYLAHDSSLNEDYNLCFPFFKLSGSTRYCGSSGWDETNNYLLTDAWAEKTSSGFKVSMERYNSNWSTGYYSRKSFSYTAVKWTE